MIQLSYEAAFDPLHAMYRAIRLREGVVAGQRLPSDLFRILDFYLLFPGSFQQIRLRPAHRKLKTRASQTRRAPPYGPRPEDPVLFERMRPYQVSALETLALQGLFSPTALEDGWVEIIEGDIPAALAARARQANTDEAGLMEALAILASDYPLTGSDGLKDRTGLLEHRYDAV